MKHVFISYVREDTKEVDRLASALKEADVKVWLDREHIEPGVDWKRAIRSAIAGGAYFVACFSKSYERKVSSFMNEELTLAIEQLRQRHEHAIWFIPLRLSDCKIPDLDIGAGRTLRSLNWLDYFDNRELALQKLLSVFMGAQEGSEEPCEPLLDLVVRDNFEERIPEDNTLFLYFTTGGTCRCAMANIITRSHLKGLSGKHRISSASAGFLAKPHTRVMSEPAQQMIRTHVDKESAVLARRHKTISVATRGELFTRADYILGFENRFKEMVPPRCRWKFDTFTRFLSGEDKDVPDPHAEGIDEEKIRSRYKEAFDDIAGLLKRNFSALLTASGEAGELDMREKRRGLQVLIPTENVYPPNRTTVETAEVACRLVADFADKSQTQSPEVLEIGTGSGLIAVAIARAVPSAHVVASDTNAEALEAANANASRNDVRIEISEADMFAGFREGAFDLIVSHPPAVPYPSTKLWDMSEGMIEATNGGADGSDLVCRFLEEGERHLKPGGALVLGLPHWCNVKKVLLVAQSRYDCVTQAKRGLAEFFPLAKGKPARSLREYVRRLAEEGMIELEFSGDSAVSPVSIVVSWKNAE